MTIEQIRGNLNNYIGKDVVIKYNLGRNKYEKYKAKITNLYNNIFSVEIIESKIKNEIKTFSYSDIITKTIKIDYKWHFFCKVLILKKKYYKIKL